MADEAYIKQLEEENEQLMKSIKDLRERVQHLVDQMDVGEDKIYEFPDGRTWEQS